MSLVVKIPKATPELQYPNFQNETRSNIFIWKGAKREKKRRFIWVSVYLPSFLSYLKTLSIGPALGIEPVISRSAVKRSTDWANPTAVEW